MNLPNDEMTCHFPKKTGGTHRDSIMRTFSAAFFRTHAPTSTPSRLGHCFCFPKTWWQVHAISSNQNTPLRLKHETSTKKPWKTARTTDWLILEDVGYFSEFSSFPSFSFISIIANISWLRDPLNRLRIAADHRQIAGRSQANAATGAVAVDFAHNDLPVSEGWMMDPGYTKMMLEISWNM